MERLRPFKSTGEASGSTLALALFSWVAASLYVNGVLFQGEPIRALRRVHGATRGLVEPTLVGSFVVLGALGVATLWVGRLRPADLGWIRAHLLPALGATAGFWLAMQAILAALLLLAGQPLGFHPHWMQRGPGGAAGALLAQALGNALAEETFFRGFLLPQLALTFDRLGRKAPRLRAAFVSSAFFALSHLPNRLFLFEMSGWEMAQDQLRLLVMGLLFSTLFLLTRNLFVATGLHVLANQPAPLVNAASGLVESVYLALFSVSLATLPLVRTKAPDALSNS